MEGEPGPARTRTILASASPQRREILARLGIDFEARVADVQEAAGGDPEEDVLSNAGLKARAVASVLAEPALPEAVRTLVIGCDTDVVLDGQILGKPGNAREAAGYLEMLSGRVHEVISGLVVIAGAEERHGIERTEVGFRTLDPAAIDGYLRTGEWEGRAGGYAIQGWGSALVESVRGDVLNVIGLPVPVLMRLAPELEP